MSVYVGVNAITVKTWILYTIVELLSNLEMVGKIETLYSTLTTGKIDFDKRKQKFHVE